ncbi:MAG: hypothetical protein AB1631_33815, partial [Acidobacteriota bacterium]
MPVKILKVYHGKNIIKVRRANGEIKFGYRITIDGKKYQPTRWNSMSDAEEARDEFRRKMRDPDYEPPERVDITISDLLQAWEKRAETRKLSAKRIHEVRSCMKRLEKLVYNKRLRK